MTARMARWVVNPATGAAPEQDSAAATIGASQALEAALCYATEMGWAVLPGCDQGRGGRRCDRTDCFTAPPHPARRHANRSATRDDATICRWWSRDPAAPILISAGHSFDVLDVPRYAATEALHRLEQIGCRLGPTAEAGDGRLLIWVAAGTRLFAELIDRRPWPHGELGLYCRGIGEYVVAPPSWEARWLEPLVPYTHRVLPRCADILGAVADACRRAAAQRSR